LCLLMFLGLCVPAAAQELRASTDKRVYLRHELVNIYASLKTEQRRSILPLTPVGITSADKRDAECTVKILRKNRLIKTVGGLDEVKMKYIPSLDRWIINWPIPWNPDLGEYSAVINLRLGGKRYAATTGFTITGRKPKQMDEAFSVMNIEPGDSIIQRVPGVGGRSVRIWENYVLWARFMGASALWHCVGQSQLWNRLDERVFPWDQTALNQVTNLGKECHKYEMKYGTWITSYLVLGNRHDLSPYKQTIGYDRHTDSLRKLIYISIYDRKRQDDIVELLKKMQSNPHVDHLGLDYMRTDFGGYEYADRFVKDMPIEEAPEDWVEMTEEDKMLWLARVLEVDKNKKIEEMWQWWRAHMMSIVISEIVQRAGINKPLWLFSLTWKQGKEHGQDPLMFIDAGVDMNAAMFYSIDKKTYPFMAEDWRNYLKQDNTNLLAGQCVDWNLLGRTTVPPGPEEHFLRQKIAVDRFLPVNPSLGLFWHDLTRAFKGTRGPYSALEWAVTGGASFTYLRRAKGFFPFSVAWDAPDAVKLNEVFTVEVNIKNTSKTDMDYYLKLLKVTNLELFGELTQKFNIGPGEIKTITFQVKAVEKNWKRGNTQMIAFMIQYGRLETQQRYFDFKYLLVE